MNSHFPVQLYLTYEDEKTFLNKLINVAYTVANTILTVLGLSLVSSGTAHITVNIKAQVSAITLSL
jgi:hypothetical protein